MTYLMKASDVWKEDYTVLLTSYWGWDPESWGTFSFTEKGRRDRVRDHTTDPFIGLIYSTITSKHGNKRDRGLICGFFLVSHEDGDRFEFTDPASHSLATDRWNYGLRPYAAFSFLPEERYHIKNFWPERIAKGGGSSLSKSGDLVPEEKISLLRELHIEPAPLFSTAKPAHDQKKSQSDKNWVPSFPDRKKGYWVGDRESNLPRRLYVLRLHGNEEQFLRNPVKGHWIVKIGLSYSPQSRCNDHQRTLPYGRFGWEVLYGTPQDSKPYMYEAAEAGELEMKKFLGKHAIHLGGEFYAATPEQIDIAWRRGNEEACVAEKVISGC